MLPRERTNPKAEFPNRTCIGCGRRGGGNPDAGLENVTVQWGREACGHCLLAYQEQKDEGAAFEKWALGWKRSREVTQP